MDILENASVIAQRDPQDALGVAINEWEQLLHNFDVTLSQPTVAIQNIVLSGMGGSALPGVMVATWPGATKPFEISRNYTIPPYVDESTLFISSSYSGNTEETLEALESALEKKAQVVVISSGGALTSRAQEKRLPLFVVPQGVQPRMCAFYFLKALTEILVHYGLTQRTADELPSIAEWLKNESQQWAQGVPVGDNLAKQIAGKLLGKTPIVYGGPLMFPAANKWKISFNENAKNTAWTYQYPEFNHNEFMGWTSHPVEKPFGVVEIRSSLEHPRVQKRFEVSERLLSGLRPAPTVVTPKGESALAQMLWSINLGDMVSIYLAILNGVNPTPVDLIERFKKALDD